MAWVLLVALALAAALAIAGPALLGRATSPRREPREPLEQLRAQLLAELRELDDDARAGRIAATDRALGRRALGPQLRAVAEALRAAGADRRP